MVLWKCKAEDPVAVLARDSLAFAIALNEKDPNNNERRFMQNLVVVRSY